MTIFIVYLAGEDGNKTSTPKYDRSYTMFYTHRYYFRLQNNTSIK